VHLVIEAPPDPGRYARLVGAAQGRQFLRFRLVGVAVALLGIVELTLFSRMPIGVGLICGGVVATLTPTLALRRGRAAAGATVNGPWTYVLSDHGLNARGPLMTNDLAWAAFQKAEETDTDVVLYLSRHQVLGIPRQSMAPGVAAELTRFLRSRGLLT
jgi:hypothetical protein